MREGDKKLTAGEILPRRARKALMHHDLTSPAYECIVRVIAHLVNGSWHRSEVSASERCAGGGLVAVKTNSRFQVSGAVEKSRDKALPQEDGLVAASWSWLFEYMISGAMCISECIVRNDVCRGRARGVLPDQLLESR